MRMTDEQQQEEYNKALRAHYLRKGREKHPNLPQDITEQEFFQAMWDETSSKIPDITDEEFSQAVHDEYGEGFEYKPVDTRTFKEKAEDAAPAIESLAVNLGAAGATMALPKTVAKIGLSGALNAITGTYYGSKIAPLLIGGKQQEKILEGLDTGDFNAMYDRFERQMAANNPEIVTFTPAGQRKKRDNPTILRAVRNVINGRNAVINSVGGELQKIGEQGQAISNEAIVNTGLNLVSAAPLANLAEGAVGQAATRAATKAGAGPITGALIGAATRGAASGAAYGGSFGGGVRVLEKWQSTPEEGADDVLARESKGILANATKFAAESAGAFGEGFKETWKAGALFGAVLGTGFGMFGILSGGAKSREDVKAQQALAARLASLERFADDMTPNEIQMRFADELEIASKNGTTDGDLAIAIASTLYPEVWNTPAGVKATVRFAETIAKVRGNDPKSVSQLGREIVQRMGGLPRPTAGAEAEAAQFQNVPGLARPEGGAPQAGPVPVTPMEPNTSGVPSFTPQVKPVASPALATAAPEVQTVVNNLNKALVEPQAPALGGPLARETVTGQAVTPELEPNVRDLGPSPVTETVPGRSAPMPPGALDLPKAPQRGLNMEEPVIEQGAPFVAPENVRQDPSLLPGTADPFAPVRAPFPPPEGPEPPGLPPIPERKFEGPKNVRVMKDMEPYVGTPKAEPVAPEAPPAPPAPVIDENSPPAVRAQSMVEAISKPKEAGKNPSIEGAEVTVKSDSIDKRVLTITKLQGQGTAGASAKALDAIHSVADETGSAVDTVLRREPKGIPLDKMQEWYGSRGYEVLSEGDGWVRMRRQPAIKDPVKPEVIAKYAEEPAVADRLQNTEAENANLAAGSVVEGEPLIRSRKGRVAKIAKTVSTQLDLFAKQAEERINKDLGENPPGMAMGLPNIKARTYRDAVIWVAAKMFSTGIRTASGLSKFVTGKLGPMSGEDVSRVVSDAKKFLFGTISRDLSVSNQVKNLLSMYEDGKAGKDWYNGWRTYVDDVFGEDAEIFTKMIGATSAGTSVEGNVGFALKAYAQWKLGLPFSGMKDRNMTNMLERIVQGRPFGDNKIHNYVAALLGDENAAALDRMLIRAFGYGRQQRAGDLNSFNASTYKFFHAIISDIAASQGVTAREMQAAIWAGEKIRNVQAAKTRLEASRTGSFRPPEDMVNRELAGRTIQQYVAELRADLVKLENAVDIANKVVTGYRSGTTAVEPFNLKQTSPKGYAVPLYSKVFNGGELSGTTLLKFVAENRALFYGNKNLVIEITDIGSGAKPPREVSVSVVLSDTENGAAIAKQIAEEGGSPFFSYYAPDGTHSLISTARSPKDPKNKFFRSDSRESSESVRMKKRAGEVLSSLGYRIDNEEAIIVPGMKNQKYSINPKDLELPPKLIAGMRDNPESAMNRLVDALNGDAGLAEKLIDSGVKLADETGASGMVVVRGNGSAYRLVNPSRENGYSMLEKIGSFKESPLTDMLKKLDGYEILAGHEIIESYRQQGGWIQYRPVAPTEDSKITNSLIATGGKVLSTAEAVAIAKNKQRANLWMTPSGKLIAVNITHPSHATMVLKRSRIPKVKNYQGLDSRGAEVQTLVNRGYVRVQSYRGSLAFDVSTNLTAEQVQVMKTLNKAHFSFFGLVSDDLGKPQNATRYMKSADELTPEMAPTAIVDFDEFLEFANRPLRFTEEQYDGVIARLVSDPEVTRIEYDRFGWAEFILGDGTRYEAGSGHQATFARALAEPGASPWTVSNKKLDDFVMNSGIVRLSTGGGIQSKGNKGNAVFAVECGHIPSVEQEQAILSWLDRGALNERGKRPTPTQLPLGERFRSFEEDLWVKEQDTALDWQIGKTTGTGLKAMLDTIHTLRAGREVAATGIKLPKFAPKFLIGLTKVTKPGFDSEVTNHVILPSGQTRHYYRQGPNWMDPVEAVARRAAFAAKMIKDGAYSGEPIPEFMNTTGVVRLRNDPNGNWSFNTGDIPLTFEQRKSLTEWLQESRRLGFEHQVLQWTIGDTRTPRSASGSGQGDLLRALDELEAGTLFADKKKDVPKPTPVADKIEAEQSKAITAMLTGVAGKGQPTEPAAWAKYKLGPSAVTVDLNGVRVSLQPARDKQSVTIEDVYATVGMGQGAGTNAMRALVDQADLAGVPLELEAAPYTNTTSMDRLELQDLITFYEKFGFTVTGETPDGLGAYMRRTPKKVMTPAAESVDEFLSPSVMDLPAEMRLLGNNKLRFVQYLKSKSKKIDRNTADSEYLWLEEVFIFPEGLAKHLKDGLYAHDAVEKGAEIALGDAYRSMKDQFGDPTSSVLSQSGVVRLAALNNDDFFVQIPRGGVTPAQWNAIDSWLRVAEDVMDKKPSELRWTIEGPNPKSGVGRDKLVRLLSGR